MLERDKYPSGVPCWIDIEPADTQTAIAFYGGLFGWEFDDRVPTETEGHYFVAKLHGRAVAAVAEMADGQPKSAWNTYISVESADEAAEKAKNAGGSIVKEPFDVLDLGRMAVIADRGGAVFRVWQAMTHYGAQLANEPGTWNFSELNTHDSEGAKSFYREMFGWELSSLDEESDSGFWRRPGYGEFLAQHDPGIVERQSDVGAPEGFADAVAWLVPTTDEQTTGGPLSHWSITFAVDDADGIAQRAAELGGEVLMAPTDFPWVRMTIISDPQGAAFTASKFTPPQ